MYFNPYGYPYPPQPMSFQANTPINANMSVEQPETEPKIDLGLDLSFFSSEDKMKSLAVQDADMQEKKKKKERKTKETGSQDSEGIIVAGQIAPAKGTVVDIDYQQSFSETNNLLRGAILKTSKLEQDISADIDTVRSSKTLKGKYTYLTNLTSTAAALVSTEVGAIKELNSSIIQAHKLELDRMKTLKVNDSDVNDDAKLMDMYSAFINAPLGSYTPNPNLAKPSIESVMLGGGALPSINIIPDQPMATEMTPEDIAMRLENNPNIKIVVMFDPSTGNRWFDVLDVATNQSVPNVPRPDPFLLEDTSLDTRNYVAVNRNIDRTWPLIVVGGAVSEY